MSPIMPLMPDDIGAATFDRPLQLLHACHGKLMHQCGTMRNLCTHLSQHGCDGQAQQAAQAILRYFTIRMRRKTCSRHCGLLFRRMTRT